MSRLIIVVGNIEVFNINCLTSTDMQTALDQLEQELLDPENDGVSVRLYAKDLYSRVFILGRIIHRGNQKW